MTGHAGLIPRRTKHRHRSHSAVCTEIKKRKTPFGQKRNKALCHKHNMPVSAVHFRAMPAISLVRRPSSSRCGQEHLIQQVTELGCRSESKAQVCNSNNMVSGGPRCHRLPNVHREQGAQNAAPYPHGRNGIEVDDGRFQQVVNARNLRRFRGLGHEQSSWLVAEASLAHVAVDVDPAARCRLLRVWRFVRLSQQARSNRIHSHPEIFSP
jgi:hypothetical protein